jgi:hypothetical protein
MRGRARNVTRPERGQRGTKEVSVSVSVSVETKLRSGLANRRCIWF